MAKEDTKAGAASPEEVQQALDLLRRTKEQRAKQRDRMKNNPEAKAKMAERALRLRVKNAILVKKAIDAGIQVTDKEIADYIAKNKAA